MRPLNIVKGLNGQKQNKTKTKFASFRNSLRKMIINSVGNVFNVIKKRSARMQQAASGEKSSEQQSTLQPSSSSAIQLDRRTLAA